LRRNARELDKEGESLNETKNSYLAINICFVAPPNVSSCSSYLYACGMIGSSGVFSFVDLSLEMYDFLLSRKNIRRKVPQVRNALVALKAPT